MRFLLTLFILGWSLPGAAQKNTIKIAFGSCSRQGNPEQVWPEVLSLNPALWIWGGDNIYADTHDMSVMKSKYDIQKSDPGYQKLIQSCKVTGTWDDHDYGINDGGRNYPKKQESKKLLLEFLNTAKKDPVRKHDGVYCSYTMGEKGKEIKIINLDTRWFRDTVYREYYFDSTLNRRRYRYLENETGDILGEQQWKWLENELKNSTADLHVINSSIQVIANEHIFEKWGNFPKARQRLFDLLKKYPTRKVLILSGDRHIGEISKLDLPGLTYPLYDITSSGLTHTWSELWEEENVHRLGELIIQKNFGFLEIDWSHSTPTVQVTIRGKDNQVFATHTIQY